MPRRNRLQRRLFLWFGATIALTAIVVGVVVGTLGPGSRRWHDDYQRFQTFGAEQFARVWHDPAARRELTEGVARAFQADVTVTDATGRELRIEGDLDRETAVVEVAAAGGLPIAAGRVEVTLDGLAIGRRDLPALEAGERRVIRLPLPPLGGEPAVL